MLITPVKRHQQFFPYFIIYNNREERKMHQRHYMPAFQDQMGTTRMNERVLKFRCELWLRVKYIGKIQRNENTLQNVGMKLSQVSKEPLRRERNVIFQSGTNQNLRPHQITFGLKMVNYLVSKLVSFENIVQSLHIKEGSLWQGLPLLKRNLAILQVFQEQSWLAWMHKWTERQISEG